tara:strand:+ start:212 stop:763 length:552 start_codon:yes stop_codon:yes gene_type:complete
MEKDILIPILITSLIWLIIVLIVYFQTKSRTEKIFENTNKKLEGINFDFNKKLEKLLAEKNSELKASYEKGYSDSENKKELSVQIIPWKEEIDSSTLFKNKKSIKVGYKHQLFSNGMPCFEPHITVVEELTVDKLNEENINRAFNNLELVMNNIPNTGNVAVKVLGNGKDIAASLMNLTKKKK